jgi:UDP-glucose 4-epimerase
MKVIVTGGAGYIGGIVADHLVKSGYEVTVLDNLSRSRREALPEGVNFVQGDVADIAELFGAGDGYEAVLHFAGFIAVGESVKEPAIYWQNNVTSSLNLLEGMRKLGINKLIFSSSAAVYGDPVNVPILETDRTLPTNPYGATKLVLDMAIASYCKAYGLAATSLRYFNACGSVGSLSERHDPESHIIPLALAAAKEGRPFTILGNDYPTEDGTCVRDYIHVADLASAHRLALEHLKPGAHGVYNLGNGLGYSNKQVAEAVSRVTGHDLEVQYGPRREGDPAVLVASSDLAKTELGWKPEHTDLDGIIADAWKILI